LQLEKTIYRTLFFDIEVLPQQKVCSPCFKEDDYDITVEEIPLLSIPQLNFARNSTLSVNQNHLQK